MCLLPNTANPPEQVDPSPSADRRLERDEVVQRVQAALAKLPPRQREAIMLHTYQELSNVETARVLDVSVEALESLLSRARRTLRSLLDGVDMSHLNALPRSPMPTAPSSIAGLQPNATLDAGTCRAGRTHRMTWPPPPSWTPLWRSGQCQAPAPRWRPVLPRPPSSGTRIRAGCASGCPALEPLRRSPVGWQRERSSSRCRFALLSQ